MMVMWISVLLLSKIYCSVYSEVVHQPDPVMMVSVGDTVTLRCFILIDHADPITWYKQTSGHQPQAVAMVQKLAKTPHFFNNFQASHFSIETDTEKCHLRISNVTLSDEAVYYCGWRRYETHFAGGTYLALKGASRCHGRTFLSKWFHKEPLTSEEPVAGEGMKLFTEGTYLALKGSQNNQYKSTVSVIQQPESAPVQFGETVNLQCSVLYEHITTDIRMFWFRSDPGKAVPDILYTHNQSNQCESDSTRSCTFKLSKNISSQIDTGTYYCAVVTCGKILFGNGTKINMAKPVDPLVMILGVLLGISVVVITAQAVLSHKKERYYINKDKRPQGIEKEHPFSQDHDAMVLSYAALYFMEGRTRSVRRKEETPQDSVYSQINNPSETEYNIVEYRSI